MVKEEKVGADEMKIFSTYEIVNGMKNCRKKPFVIQAIQMTEPFKVETLEGWVKGNTGDYLMKGVDGELYPCKREIFEKSYEWLE